MEKQTVRKHVRSRSGHFAVFLAIFTVVDVKKKEEEERGVEGKKKC